MKEKVVLMDQKEMKRALARISHEIIEKNKGVQDLILIGIETRGVPLAHRIAENIKKYEGEDVLVDFIDITFYRDDLEKKSEQPQVNSSLNVTITDKIVVLVDDVLYTGRTCRAAMNAIMDFGRPKKVELAVMIDRGHRELPIRPDFIGKNIPTSGEEIVRVCLKEVDGEEQVVLSKVNN